MKFNLNLAAILLISLIAATQADIKPVNVSMDCTIGNINYVYFGIQQSCTAKGKLNIVNINSTITSVNGGSNPNTRVNVFYVLAKVAKYVPSGLDVIFPNLMGFRFESSQLKLVSKANLKPFPNLLMFASVGNQVEYLEKDLFIYNTKIEYISFRANRISYIDPTVFSVISGTLQQFYMDGQAIACGLGNTITPNAVKNALSKLNSSICADITNAPPLYVLLLDLQEQLSNGGSDNQACQDQLTACNGNLTEVQTNLTAANGALTQATADLETLNTTLLSTNAELTTCNSTAEQCATELATCKTGTCAADLASCQTDLTDATDAKTACETANATCDGELTTCTTESGTCTSTLDKCTTDKDFCEGCRATPADPACV